MPIGFWVAAVLALLALAFAFMNGFHDAADSIATVVSTRVPRPPTAAGCAAAGASSRPSASA
jgi:PiT family inorganic phosphate transporter